MSHSRTVARVAALVLLPMPWSCSYQRSAGMLQPKGREATWDATTAELDIQFTVDNGTAIVHYTIRSDRGFRASVGESDP